MYFLSDVVADFNVSKFLPKNASNVRARKIAADLLKESRKNVRKQAKKHGAAYQPIYHDVAHSSMKVMSKHNPDLLGKTKSGKTRRASNVGFTPRNEMFVEPYDSPLHYVATDRFQKTYPRIGRRGLVDYYSDRSTNELSSKTKQTQKELARKIWRDKDYRKARYAITMDALDSRSPDTKTSLLGESLIRTAMRGKGSGTWIHNADKNRAKRVKTIAQPVRYKDSNYRKNNLWDR